MRGEESDFFPLWDVFQEGFDFERHAVGVDRKTNEHKSVFIQIRALIDLFYLFVMFQCFINRLRDFLRVSCDAEVSDESFQRRIPRLKFESDAEF